MEPAPIMHDEMNQKSGAEFKAIAVVNSMAIEGFVLSLESVKAFVGAFHDAVSAGEFETALAEAKEFCRSRR